MGDIDPGFRQLVERSPDAVIIGRDGTILYVNQAAVLLLGHAGAADLIGGPTLQLVHPDERELFRVRLERALAGEPNPVVVRRIRRADGSYVLLEGSLFAIDFGGQRAAAFIGRASEARRRADQEFRALVDSIPGAVAVHSEGRFLYLNPAAVRALGYQSASELLGKSFLDLVVPEDRVALAQALALRLATGAPAALQRQRLLRRDGTPVLLEGMAIGVTFEGLPARLMVARDITEQRDTEERLRAIIEASPLAVASLDLEYRVQTLNPAAAKLFHWTPPHELLPENIALMASLCERARALGAVESEHEMPRRDGTSIHLRLAVAPLRDARGEVTGYVVLAADVTEVRRGETARRVLEASLRRAEAVSAMGALVAGVAHEIRNPIFGMSAALDAIEALAARGPPPERLVQSLRRELDRINRLVSDLLDYGKPLDSQLSPEPVAPVILQALRACQPRADAAQVSLETAPLAEVGELPMQPARLLQVFQNLIDNAVQHSRPGQGVRVEWGLAGDGQVEVRVLDRGPGFSEQDLPHVFEPFFSRRAGGTGLGLSIVQRIVEQHRGTVIASNREGGGACVLVRLPP